MTVKPKYYFNLDGNITDGEKEYSLYNIKDVVGGLSISSGLKERYVLYGRNSLLDLLNELYEKDRDGEECYRKLLEKYDTLKEENEELKIDAKYWAKTAETRLKRINIIYKENEQLKEENEFAKLLANNRGEMIAFADSLIQDVNDELTQKMWYQFKEEMYQKWKKKRGIE